MAFKSALIAHLTVQGKTRPVETLSDLVQLPGWGWAFDPWMLTGVVFQYFSQHTDPVVKKIYHDVKASIIRMSKDILSKQ